MGRIRTRTQTDPNLGSREIREEYIEGVGWKIIWTGNWIAPGQTTPEMNLGEREYGEVYEVTPGGVTRTEKDPAGNVLPSKITPIEGEIDVEKMRQEAEAQGAYIEDLPGGGFRAYYTNFVPEGANVYQSGGEWQYVKPDSTVPTRVHTEANPMGTIFEDITPKSWEERNPFSQSNLQSWGRETGRTGEAALVNLGMRAFEAHPYGAAAWTIGAGIERIAMGKSTMPLISPFYGNIIDAAKLGADKLTGWETIGGRTYGTFQLGLRGFSEGGLKSIVAPKGALMGRDYIVSTTADWLKGKPVPAGRTKNVMGFYSDVGIEFAGAAGSLWGFSKTMKLAEGGVKRIAERQPYKLGLKRGGLEVELEKSIQVKDPYFARGNWQLTRGEAFGEYELSIRGFGTTSGYIKQPFGMATGLDYVYTPTVTMAGGKVLGVSLSRDNIFAGLSKWGLTTGRYGGGLAAEGIKYYDIRGVSFGLQGQMRGTMTVGPKYSVPNFLRAKSGGLSVTTPESTIFTKPVSGFSKGIPIIGNNVIASALISQRVSILSSSSASLPLIKPVSMSSISSKSLKSDLVPSFSFGKLPKLGFGGLTAGLALNKKSSIGVSTGSLVTPKEGLNIGTLFGTGTTPNITTTFGPVGGGGFKLPTFTGFNFDLGSGGKLGPLGTSFNFKYSPSLTARYYGIKAKGKPKKVFTGLEIRGLL